MVGYVLVHNEAFLINRADPVWQHYKPFRWWLLPHGLAGASLLLGPLQFSDRLRQRFTKFHRVVGRIYITGALIVAPLGAYIQFFEERMGGPRSFSIAALAGVTGWERIPGAIETIVWGCLAFSLLSADIVLQVQELRRSHPVAVRAQVAAS